MSRRSISAVSRSFISHHAAPARCFASSSRMGMASTFVETSNAELNQTLQRIQKEYILPALLPEKQRKIIFDPKKASYMQSNPIDLEIDGIEHRFAPMNRFKLENSKKLLSRALAQMKDKEDWEQLQILLAGYRRAGIVLKPHQVSKAVRLAGMSGQVYSIIECAKQSQDTGVTFSNKENMLRVLQFINEKILNSDRDLAATKQASKWTDIVLDLAERQQTGFKVHNARLIRGMILFTRASLVKAKQEAGESVEEDMVLLRDNVENLNTLWKDNLNHDRISADLLRLGIDSTSRWSVGSTVVVWMLAENIFGMRLAREVLGDEAVGNLDQAVQTLQQFLVQYIQKENGVTKTRLNELYQRLFGSTTS